jgi:short-subunit dehydrogenase
MRKLAGCNAIVTGASAGIGLHVARALAAEGVNLALAARSGDKLESLAAELSSCGVRAVAIPTDVARTQDLEHLVGQAGEYFGTIDILVNNAGIESFHEFHTLSLDRIRATIEVNLTAALMLCRLVLPRMLETRRGHIVNMSSTAGKHGPAYGGAYGASKAGLIALTQSLRSEYRGTGISASVVCPGFTEGGGMYEHLKQLTGHATPWLLGSATSHAVARAVLRAIQQDVPELIVNRPPIRPLTILLEAFPRLGERIVRKVSNRFLKRIALARRAETQ